MEHTICLASQSKSRQDILKSAHVRFEILTSSIDEVYENEPAQDLVLKLAKQKSEDVLDKTKAQVVVGADSVAVYRDEIIQKPKDKDDAITMLYKLQGKTHSFYTGLHVINTENKEAISKVIKTKVSFSQMNLSLIQKYVERFKPYSFAGGYDNSISSWFIEKVKGSSSNMKGLPMTALKEMIEQLGFIFFDFIE